jgi:hypothetical protein
LSDESDKIDNKAIAIFSVSSVIVGILASLIKVVTLNWTITPLLLAVLSYIFLAWKTITAFTTREVIVAENPTKLKEKYWELPEDKAKEKYWESLEQACNYNLYVVEQKGKALRQAIPALTAEVILLIVWLLLRSFT